jgi:hypothetical protein
LFFLQFSHSREEAEQMMAMKDRTLPLWKHWLMAGSLTGSRRASYHMLAFISNAEVTIT